MSMPPFFLDRRRFLQTTLAGATASAFGVPDADAQGRAETLLVVQELGANSLDMQGVGSNQTVNGLSWNCYDRLLTYASKTLPNGTQSYDREKLAPDLAESTLNKKELPLALNRFSGWLDYPEYYFYWNFHGNNSIFNISSYQNRRLPPVRRTISCVTRVTAESRRTSYPRRHG